MAEEQRRRQEGRNRGSRHERKPTLDNHPPQSLSSPTPPFLFTLITNFNTNDPVRAPSSRPLRRARRSSPTDRRPSGRRPTRRRIQIRIHGRLAVAQQPEEERTVADGGGQQGRRRQGRGEAQGPEARWEPQR